MILCLLLGLAFSGCGTATPATGTENTEANIPQGTAAADIPDDAAVQQGDEAAPAPDPTSSGSETDPLPESTDIDQPSEEASQEATSAPAEKKARRVG